MPIAQFEPKLSKAVEHIFGESYEWTRKYKEYQKETKVAGYYAVDKEGYLAKLNAKK